MSRNRGDRRSDLYALFRAGLTAAACVAGAIPAHSAFAADRYWDPAGNAADNNLVTGAGLGGGGTWDAGSFTWWDGVSATDQTWNDAASDRAVFWGPSPGTIALDGPRTASGLVFKTNGYSLVANFLTLAGPATLDADAGVNATLSPILLGTSGLTKTGPGTVFVNNINNEFTGPVTVDGGVLAFSHESLTPSDKAQLGRVPTSNATPGSGITLNGATLRAELFQGGQGPPPPATIGPTRRIDLTAAGGTLDVVDGVILGLGADGGGALASGGIYSSAGGRLTKTGAGRVAVSKNTNTAPHSFVGLTVRQGTWSIFQTDAVVAGTGGNPVGAQPPANPPNAAETRKYALILDYNGLGGGAVFRFRGLTDPGGAARTDIVLNNDRPLLIGPGGGTFDTNGSATSHGGTGGVANTGAFSGILALNAPGTGTLTKANDGEFYHAGDASYGALVVNRGSWAIVNEAQLGTGSAASPAINVTLDTSGAGSQPATLRIVQGNVNMAAPHTLTIGPGGGTVCTDNAGVVWNGPLVGTGTLTKAGYAGLVASPFIGDSAGAGTLTLATDSPAFTGGIVVRTGTLIAASALKLGDDASPANTLTLDGGTFRAAGSFTMNRAVSLGPAGGQIDTDANNFTLAGVVSGSGFAKAGSGTLTFTGANTYTGVTAVTAGTLQVNNAASAPLLTGPGGTDIQSGRVVFDYAGGSAPDVRSLLAASFASGFTSGQIRSTTIAPNRALGYLDDIIAQRTTVMYTVNGDANLSGDVTIADINIAKANFGGTGDVWATGDFNYDGVTTIADINTAKARFGNTLPLMADNSGSSARSASLQADGSAGPDQIELIVNIATGQVQMVGNNADPGEITSYEVRSLAGSLNLAGYTSLADQGRPGWGELPGTQFLVGEDHGFTADTVDLAGFSLGNLFAVGGTQDLQFNYGNENFLTIAGSVTYVPEPAGFALVAGVAGMLGRRRRARAREVIPARIQPSRL